MISLLLPTRKRPDNLKRLHRSVIDTAHITPQFSIYVDDDDHESKKTADSLGMFVTVGPRILLSESWNVAYRAATGDILMHCGDDIVFRSPGWDERIEQTFAESADKIIFAHGDDMSGNGRNAGTHGFLHRHWVEVVGYFVPPLFSSDYNDTWLNYVADTIQRRVYVDSVITEHLHPSFGKAELDDTHLERMERGRKDRVTEIWENTRPERQLDVSLLTAYINNWKTNERRDDRTR